MGFLCFLPQSSHPDPVEMPAKETQDLNNTCSFYEDMGLVSGMMRREDLSVHGEWME